MPSLSSASRLQPQLSPGRWTAADATTNHAVPLKSKPPILALSGTGAWTIREFIGDAVVNGSGELQGRNIRHTRSEVLVAATVDADDGTLPGPGECEGAITTVSAYGTPPAST